MEETVEKETFHQVMLRVAGVCGAIGMLSLPMCSWCLEGFASEGASQCWIKTSAGKSSLALANWPCLDSVEVSFKNYPLHQCYWWKLSGWSSSRERGWSSSCLCGCWGKSGPEHADCASPSLAAGRGEGSAQLCELGLVLELLHWWDGKGDSVNTQGTEQPPLGWELQCCFFGKNMLHSTRQARGWSIAGPVSVQPPHLLRLLSVCVSPVLAPRNLETLGRMSSLSLWCSSIADSSST